MLSTSGRPATRGRPAGSLERPLAPHQPPDRRRGFGASSQPAEGYDIETRVSDLLAVLDSLGLARVNLVGHSIAGDELTGFASRHPGRVRRLVYLDAASDHRVTISGARPPFPPITAADSASPAALQALSARLGRPIPEADLRATIKNEYNNRNA